MPDESSTLDAARMHIEAQADEQRAFAGEALARGEIGLPTFLGASLAMLALRTAPMAPKKSQTVAAKDRAWKLQRAALTVGILRATRCIQCRLNGETRAALFPRALWRDLNEAADVLAASAFTEMHRATATEGKAGRGHARFFYGAKRGRFSPYDFDALRFFAPRLDELVPFGEELPSFSGDDPLFSAAIDDVSTEAFESTLAVKGCSEQETAALEVGLFSIALGKIALNPWHSSSVRTFLEYLANVDADRELFDVAAEDAKAQNPAPREH